MQTIIEFPPSYTKEAYKLTLCHRYFTFAFMNDLHLVAPLEIAALSFCLMVIDNVQTTIVCFLNPRGIPLITPLSLRRGDGGEAVMGALVGIERCRFRWEMAS